MINDFPQETGTHNNHCHWQIETLPLLIIQLLTLKIHMTGGQGTESHQTKIHTQNVNNKMTIVKKATQLETFYESETRQIPGHFRDYSSSLSHHGQFLSSNIFPTNFGTNYCSQ
jgi:hypothetical protein